jgi:nucleotide-binding universal stress UspA family protein
MTIIVVILVLVVVALAVFGARERRLSHRGNAARAHAARRILFPFLGTELSERGLDAALRIAQIDGATLVPAFLARVPMNLPLDTALPVACDGALPLLEAIEQRAARSGVTVDSRIERGRSYRHAIRELVEHESFDTTVVTAADNATTGLLPDEISWLLEHVPGEIIVIRPGTADLQAFPARNGHPRQRWRRPHR